MPLRLQAGGPAEEVGVGLICIAEERKGMRVVEKPCR